jgi:hypothetical protein
LSGAPSGQQPLSQRLERVTAEAHRSEAAISGEEAQHIREVDRAFTDRQGRIASLVLWLFLILIVVVAGCYVISPFLAAGSDLRESAKALKDLVNTLVLPIVTLVLGFYFGERNRRRW